MSLAHSSPAATTRHTLGDLIGRIAAAAIARAERSKHRRLGFAFLPPEVLQDIAMSAEEATGQGSYRPDLPFFMQPGFGRR